MQRNQNKHIVLEHIEITDTAARGKSIGKAPDGRVVFVANTVPGDIVTVHTRKKRRGYYEGVPTIFHKLSNRRATPVCKYFGVCGGCKWQHMDYVYQLSAKQREVEENLRRIGKVIIPTPLPIIPANKQYQYRNKMEFSFSNNRWLTDEEILEGQDIIDRNAFGFHVSGRWDKVLDIDECHLHSLQSEYIRKTIKSIVLGQSHTFYDLRERKGLLRSLMIRTTTTGQLMALIQFGENDKDAREQILEAIKIQCSDISSLLYVINTKANETLYDLDIECYHGEPYIIEQMGDLKFKIGAKSFYQTNSIQAEQLYQIITEFAQFGGDEIVYDLYTGTGTIAQYIASQVKRIVAIESVPEAIADAEINAGFNNITNIDFFVGDMRALLSDDFVQHQGKPQLVITDPPRDGMHPRVVNQLLSIAPDKIIYVSCNSATQARDIELMKEHYRIDKFQSIDMFPQTHHVENVVLLVKLDFE